MLNFLVEKRGANTSSVVRDAIRVLYGLLSGAKNISTDTVIINNPNVILNVNEAINSISIDSEVLLKENKILREEKRRLKEVINFYEKELRKRDEDIKELQEKLRKAESRLRELDNISSLREENERLRYRIKELKRTVRYALSFINEEPELAKKILEQEG